MMGKRAFLVVLLVSALLLILFIVLTSRPLSTAGKTSAVKSTPAGQEGVASAASGSDTRTAPVTAGQVVSYSGHVWSARGRAISAARVELRVKDAAVATTATDESGAYTLAQVPGQAGKVLVASADGYESSEQRIDDSTHLTKAIDFFLRPSGCITGIVGDQRQRPLPGFVVSGKCDDGYTALSSRTENDGRFTLEGLEEGNVVIFATLTAPNSSKGRAFWADENKVKVELRKGERREGVRLTIPWNYDLAVSGTVIDDEERPLQNAQIIAWGGGGELTSVGLSDKNGAFRVEDLVKSSVTGEDLVHVGIQADLEGYETFSKWGVPVGTEDLLITMPKIRGGRIVGVVLDKTTREPITTAHVAVAQNRAADGRLRYGPEGDVIDTMRGAGSRVDSEGRFRILEVPSGEVSLLVYAPGYGLSVHEGVDVQPNRDSDIEILLEPTGTLRVHVTYVGDLEGREIGCWLIYKLEQSQEWSPFSQGEIEQLVTTGKGPSTLAGPKTYELRVQPGSYQVAMRFEAPATSPFLAGSVNFQSFSAYVRSGETTEMDFPVGGKGLVQGSSSPMSEGERLRLVLVPGTTFPKEAIPKVADEWDVIGYTEGQGMFAHASPTYEINCIPDGTWTVGAFVIDSEDKAVTPRGFQTFQIRAGDAIVWDVPEP